MPEYPTPSDTPETRPAATRRQIQKELRGHLEYLQFLIEKYPDSTDQDDLLMLKRDVSRALVCL